MALNWVIKLGVLEDPLEGEGRRGASWKEDSHIPMQTRQELRGGN